MDGGPEDRLILLGGLQELLVMRKGVCLVGVGPTSGYLLPYSAGLVISVGGEKKGVE